MPNVPSKLLQAYDVFSSCGAEGGAAQRRTAAAQSVKEVLLPVTEKHCHIVQGGSWEGGGGSSKFGYKKGFIFSYLVSHDLSFKKLLPSHRTGAERIPTSLGSKPCLHASIFWEIKIFCVIPPLIEDNKIKHIKKINLLSR